MGGAKGGGGESEVGVQTNVRGDLAVSAERKLIGHIIHRKHCLSDGGRLDEPDFRACLVVLSSFILQTDSSLFTLPVFVLFPPLSARPRLVLPTTPFPR